MGENAAGRALNMRMLRSGVAFGAFRTMLVAGIGAWGALAPGRAVGREPAPPGTVALASCAAGFDLKGDRQEVAALSRALGRYRAGPPAAGRCRRARWAVTMWRAGDRLTLEI